MNKAVLTAESEAISPEGVSHQNPIPYAGASGDAGPAATRESIMLLTYSCQCLLCAAIAVASLSQDQPPLEQLPLPKEAAPELIETPPLPAIPPRVQCVFPRNPYGRMNGYTRDRYGYLRPKVVYGPNGAYYPLTGEPYLFSAVEGIK